MATEEEAEPLPNPGSRPAGEKGCTCSPLFNNYGEERPVEGWNIRDTCPIHKHLVTE